MARFSPEWLADYNARRAAKTMSRDPEWAEYERDLHVKIENECRRRGYVVVHSRMDKPTTTGLGVCDFIIFADNGRVLLIECKSRRGKLSLEQLAFIAALKKLGHDVHVIGSLKEFFQLLSSPTYTAMPRLPQ